MCGLSPPPATGWARHRLPATPQLPPHKRNPGAICRNKTSRRPSSKQCYGLPSEHGATRTSVSPQSDCSPRLARPQPLRPLERAGPRWPRSLWIRGRHSNSSACSRASPSGCVGVAARWGARCGCRPQMPQGLTWPGRGTLEAALSLGPGVSPRGVYSPLHTAVTLGGGPRSRRRGPGSCYLVGGMWGAGGRGWVCPEMPRSKEACDPSVTAGPQSPCPPALGAPPPVLQVGSHRSCPFVTELLSCELSPSGLMRRPQRSSPRHECK